MNATNADIKHVVALSGGKDSTALALRLAEVEPRDYIYIISPTGNELPEMVAQWLKLSQMLGKPLTPVTTGQSLQGLIREQNALPNWRQRWCTRILKIEPTIEWVRANNPAIMYVGLRADEETREGIYAADVESRFPLREWGWGKKDVVEYLAHRGVTIPERTDCALCYDQQLREWRNLLERHPDLYAEGERYEELTGFTFRSPGRDSKPAALKELRPILEKEIAIMQEKRTQGILFEIEDVTEMKQRGRCRVCHM